ncbi:MAG: hypothetical protein M3N68_14645, partial [Actinomycetota bacterium]|nr:hypothetical protein [Actinomycetota bacterium]
VRAAFRRLLRVSHPDVAGAEAGATARTARLIAAYERLRAAPGEEEAAAAAPEPVGIAVVDDDTLAFDAPADEAFLCLLELAHQLGEVTYVDPDGGLLESVVQLEAGPTCSLVMTLQGRGTGTTEVFCTLEPLGSTAPLPRAAAVDVVVEGLRSAPRRPC